MPQDINARPRGGIGGARPNDGYQPKKRVLLLELRERTSQRGNRYLSGWAGKAALIGFAEEVADDGSTLWRVYAEEPKQGGGR